jgi:hypothetical protein
MLKCFSPDFGNILMTIPFLPKFNSVLRVSLLNSFLLSLAIAAPAVAAPAVLSGSEPGSRVNVRSGPSTAASTPHYGIVGDRIETLRQTQGNDGYIWYYIRFNQSGAEGWVRSDLIRFLGRSPSSRKIRDGRYAIGPTDMTIIVKGQRYQYYSEVGPSAWKPISDLTYIREGVLFADDSYWCLASMTGSRSSACTANGWRSLRR